MERENGSRRQRRTHVRFIFAGFDTGANGVLNDVIGS